MSGRFFLILVGILALGGWLIAQSESSRVAYVNSVEVVQAHSQFSKVKEVQDQAKAEINPLNEQLKALQNKIQAGSATQADKDKYVELSKSVRDLAAKWAKKQNELLDPINEAANTAVSKVAKDQNFGIVFDYSVANESSLVIYAEKELDITDAVIGSMKK